MLAADNRAIRDRFGWQPSYDIDDALQHLWDDPDLSEPLRQRYRR